MSIREDIPELEMHVDPNLKDDTVLQMGKNSITYGELKEMYNRQQDPINCLIYWDDICQYTSLGLIEVLNALSKTDVKVDLEQFFTRSNEYDIGIKYVYKLFENKLSKEEINKTKNMFYWKIMQLSFKSSLFLGLTKMSNYFTSLGFYFPCKFANCELLRSDLEKIFFPSSLTTKKVNFYYGKEDDIGFNNVLKNNNYNSIITPNIVSTLDFIIKNDLKKITIIGPDNHNGIDEELYNMFCKYHNLPRPNNCEIALFAEQIVQN